MEVWSTSLNSTCDWLVPVGELIAAKKVEKSSSSALRMGES